MKTKSSPAPVTVGQHFGLYTIQSKSIRPYYWFARCSCCGESKEVRGDNLTSGRIVSCGRHRTKHGATAGGTKTPTYESWRAMRARCRDIKDKHYGARGIKVCESWAEFSNFFRDMHERPEGHTLDRIDVLGDYTPKNCMWSTDTEQRDNRTDTKYLVYQSSYNYYKNTPREWAAYLAGSTSKPWDTKTLRAALKFLTLTQILGATSDCRRTPDELVEEEQRRRHERARRSFGMAPGPNHNHVRDEADDAIEKWLGADEPSRPEPILPEFLTKADLAAMEEMERFVMA